MNGRRPHPYFTINLAKERQLRLSNAWFSHLHETRDTISHVDGDGGSSSHFFAFKILGKDIDERIGLSPLRTDILTAVKAIGCPRALSDRDSRQAGTPPSMTGTVPHVKCQCVSGGWPSLTRAHFQRDTERRPPLFRIGRHSFRSSFTDVRVYSQS